MRTKNPHHIFVITAPGLEQILSSEIGNLGIAKLEVVDGGVSLAGSVRQLYELNLHLRTASRVIVRIAEFHASSFHELERRARRINWSEYLRPGSRARFRVTCRKSRLYHSDAVAERFAESVAQQVAGVSASSAQGAPSELADMDETDDGPAQLFVVRLTHDECVVSADSSGELLHRRGYRQATGKAPIRETLAAAMVIGSGWDSTCPLVDPLCGSGTIPIEAALIARRIAPGMNRAFAFQAWPTYDSGKWESVLAKSRDQIRPATSGIIGSDRDAGAIQSARANAERAGVLESIDLDVRAISSVDFPPAPGWIVTNPPYGVRVGEHRTIRNLYAQLGKTIRSRARGYAVALLSPEARLESALGIPLTEVFHARNGGIPVRLVKGSAPD
ncbi:MAG TPA: class I SAM-dependent RNA methyltransferase [Rhodothermia bacterium]|nr:class I SAM-dependent RNA methyltransferase [Rhodothermia bacterium]